MTKKLFPSVQMLCMVALPLTVGVVYASGGHLRQTGQNARTQSIEPASFVGYKSWKCVTAPEGYWVSYSTSGLCVQLSRPEDYNRLLREEHNPHESFILKVYVNKVGEPAFSGEGYPHYPVGTVIVKEKYAGSSTTPMLMTIMIKRQPGYDTVNGDWQYITLDSDGLPILLSTQKHCQDCHQKVREQGFVFRSYCPIGVSTER